MKRVINGANRIDPETLEEYCNQVKNKTADEPVLKIVAHSSKVPQRLRCDAIRQMNDIEDLCKFLKHRNSRQKYGDSNIAIAAYQSLDRLGYFEGMTYSQILNTVQPPNIYSTILWYIGQRTKDISLMKDAVEYDDHPNFIQGVLINRNCPQDIKDSAATSRHAGVREYVADYTKSPEILEVLSHDSNSKVRSRAKFLLKRMQGKTQDRARSYFRYVVYTDDEAIKSFSSGNLEGAIKYAKKYTEKYDELTQVVARPVSEAAEDKMDPYSDPEPYEVVWSSDSEDSQ